VPRKPELIARKSLAAHDPRVRLLDDFIHEQERLAVRDGGLNRFTSHIETADQRR
jgi:hypothetical protein